MKPNNKPTSLFTLKNQLKFESGFVPARWVLISLVLTSLFLVGRLKSTPAPQASDAAAVDLKWDSMVASFQRSIDRYDGEVGVYVKNLRTGRVYQYNSDRPFVSASLIKIPIMLATFQAISEGRLSMDTKILYKRSYRRGGSGRMKWAKSGVFYPISQLMHAMMTKSDNTATAMVIDRLGYDYLNESFRKFGLTTTRINSTGMSLANYIDPKRDNYTTAREMASLLEKLYAHEFFEDGSSDLMIEIMKGANTPTRLAQHLPKNFQLARKTGLLRRHCHDVGIVYSPQGDLVISVLTGHNRNYRRAKNFIASLGQTAYEYYLDDSIASSSSNTLQLSRTDVPSNRHS
jgi:beta-lactamase class A